MTHVSVVARPTTRAALDTLESVGDALQIARHLHALGIRGARHNARACAIAVYLTEETGVPHLVGPDRAHPLNDNGDDEYFTVGPSVGQFIAFFDSGLFAELVVPFTPARAAVSPLESLVWGNAA